MNNSDAGSENSLTDLRAYVEQRDLASCRLVHYVGLGAPNAKDVPLSEVEAEVAGCVAEGLRVAWNESGKRLYLCVQEPDCPMPPWENVFHEEGLVDEQEILRAAGFNDAT